jgi:TfoX/Sxy family transcriptional regulator of competence genes
LRRRGKAERTQLKAAGCAPALREEKGRERLLNLYPVAPTTILFESPYREVRVADDVGSRVSLDEEVTIGVAT